MRSQFVILIINIIMSIQFPILNISLSNLSSQDLEETHIGDLWDYPGDNSIFEEYYNNQKYVGNRELPKSTQKVLKIKEY